MSSYKIVLETEREMDAAATFLWWRLLLSIAPEVSHENPYCGLQFTLTLHNVIDVDTFIWHTTMCPSGCFRFSSRNCSFKRSFSFPVII